MTTRSSRLELEAAWEKLTRSDDLLADILIRLPTLADLGRAAASYVAFRRVVTSHHFHRRLRALHPPSLLGVHALSTGEFYPVESPNSSAPAARDLAACADFGFSFLPAQQGSSWMARDIQDGRFFLVDSDAGNGDAAFTMLAVCDPLHRSYVLLPPIPEELAVAVEQPHLVNVKERRCEVFFLPCSEEEYAAAAATGSPDPFRVMWMAQCPAKLVVFLFSSATGQWQAVASPSWQELNPDMPATTDTSSLSCRNYAQGCFFWLLSNPPNDRKLLVLNTRTMEFTAGKCPDQKGEFAIIMELGESKLQMFFLRGSILSRFSGNRQNEGTYQWTPLKSFTMLALPCKYNMLGAFGGNMLLQIIMADDDGCTVGSGCFWIDFKSSVSVHGHSVRGVLGDEFHPPSALHIGYPPSLSPPAI